MTPEEIEPRVTEALKLLQGDIESATFYARRGHPEDVVLCMVAGKSLRLSLAVCRLVSGGFYGEGMGVTRSVLESFFITKWVGNNPESRAHSYTDFAKAHLLNREQIREKYFPLEKAPEWYTQNFIDKVKAKFPNTHIWETAHNMATERSRHPDDIDPRTGKGFQAIADYESTYEIASQYVHCTIISSFPNLHGFPYRVPSNDRETDKGFLALHFTLAAARQVCMLLSRHWGRRINNAVTDKIEALLSDLRTETSDTAVWRIRRPGSIP